MVAHLLLHVCSCGSHQERIKNAKTLVLHGAQERENRIVQWHVYVYQFTSSWPMPARRDVDFFFIIIFSYDTGMSTFVVPVLRSCRSPTRIWLENANANNTYMIYIIFRAFLTHARVPRSREE